MTDRIKDNSWKFDAEHYGAYIAAVDVSQILRKLRTMPVHLLSSSLGLIGGLEIIQEAISLVREMVSDDLYVFPRLNPDLIVGQTDTSNDKTSVGTVKSRKVAAPGSADKITSAEFVSEVLTNIEELLVLLKVHQKNAHNRRTRKLANDAVDSLEKRMGDHLDELSKEISTQKEQKIRAYRRRHKTHRSGRKRKQSF